MKHNVCELILKADEWKIKYSILFAYVVSGRKIDPKIMDFFIEWDRQLGPRTQVVFKDLEELIKAAE